MSTHIPNNLNIHTSVPINNQAGAAQISQPTVTATTPLPMVDGVESRLVQEGGGGEIGGAPPLPDVAGKIDDAGAAWRTDWMFETGDAALMWMTMSELARTSMRDMSDAKTAKRAFQDGKIDAKKQQTAATEKEQEAERDEAFRQFTDSVITAVIVCAISYGSTQVGQAVGEGAEGTAESIEAANQAKQMAVANAAAPIGQVYSTYASYQSKEGGPQRQADEKRLEGMRWDQQAEMMDQMVEESQGSYEESKELFKLSLRILTEHYELRNQSTQAFTKG